MRTLFVWLCMLCASAACAQYSISAAEYFFDTDPGVGHGLPLATGAAADTVLVNNTVSIASLSIGFHVMGLRTQNGSGRWSLTEARPFYVSAPQLPLSAYQVDKAEYFYDSDPGVGNGLPLATGVVGDSILVNDTVSLASLGIGFHIMSVRTHNTNGKWSLTESRPFYIYGPQLPLTATQIDKAEYFYDTDLGVGHGLPLATGAVGDSIIVNDTVGLATLHPGFHIMSVRTHNTNGKWSLTESRPFYIVDSLAHNALQIVSAEYFVDTDPGVGAAHALALPRTPNDTIRDTVAIPSNYSYGTHTLVTRTRNNLGEWSLSEARNFLVYNCSLAVSDSINNVTCGGAQNGSVYITIHGGNHPVTTLWSNSNPATHLQGIQGGTYIFTATDSLGCVAKDTAVVYEPPALVINSNVNNLLCAESTNGAIDLNVQGGLGHYTYHWSNNNTTANNTGLTGGGYNVTVTDSTGCVKTSNFFLNTPSPLSSFQNVTICPDSTYNFNGMILTTGGTYTDSLTGTHGCDSVATVFLAFYSNPPIPVISQIGNTLSTDPGYAYQWYLNGTAIGTNSNTLSITQNGNYTVLVSYNGSCGISSAVYIVTHVGLENIATEVFSIYPNPTNSVINITISMAVHNASIKISDATGRAIDEKAGQSGSSFSMDLSKEAAGIYYVEINSAEGTARQKFVKM